MERLLDALPEGTKLAGYIIGRVLGRGGFGVTYFARDALFPDANVAIKEFLPAGLAVREPGSLTVHPTGAGYAEDFKKALSRFEEEARTLVALRHPNVVEVQRFIEANGTAYIVMKFEKGRALDKLLGDGKTLSASELDELIPPLLGGVEAIHARNFLHRDIKPGNIYIRAADGSPVLLDFGTARVAMGADRKTSFTQHLTPGYAPFEQYSRKGNQGPWTDIHALGATFYRCVAGQRPPDAPDRVAGEEMIPAREAGRGRYPDALLAAIDTMLMVDEKKRPQSIAEVRALLATGHRAKTHSAASASTIVVPLPPSPSPKPLEWPAGNVPPKPQRWPHDDPVPSPPQPRSRAGSYLMTLVLTGAVLVGGYYLVKPAANAPPSAASTTPSTSSATPPAPSPLLDGQVFRDCPDCPELVVIPSGSFAMGSPAGEPSRDHNEDPQHSVNIAGRFALGRYEVTFMEFDACVADGGCKRRPNEGRDMTRPDSAGWGRGSQPVVSVSWAEAKDYVAWLSRKTGKNYRLPSEAEWEYAARAGTATAFSFGPEITTNQANYNGVFALADREYAASTGRSLEKTVPVGSFPPNAFGLYEMHGNVAEWVEDCWNNRYIGAPNDGGPWLLGDCANKVVRGGSWGSYPWAVRSASRYSMGAASANNHVGFRVARALD